MGGDWLCKGASSLALRLKVSPIIIGLTIVSAATSLPEMITSLAGALQGSSGIALGNVIGSNLANSGLILGIAALVYPITIHSRIIRKEVPFLILVTGLFSIFCYTGVIQRWMGLILIGLLAVYILFLIRQSTKVDKLIEREYTQGIPQETYSILGSLLFIAGGSLFLAFGAELAVDTAIELAYRLNVSDTLIGLTLIAIGTSLPELAACVIAAKRGQSDLCAGNIMGSNLFNLLFIGGGVSAIIPLGVDPSLLGIEIPALVITTLLLSLICLTDLTVTRLEGALLVLLYMCVILLSGMSQTGIFII
tara:strand:- start:25184 stop:26104 length:921 start_codon:yes stop_codon:yes gene_type:complete